MRYYTPGHGVVPDALILHGLLKILHLNGQVEGCVENIGERFLAEVPDGVDLGVLERWELGELLELARKGVYVGKIKELQLSAIDIAGFKTWISRLADAYNSLIHMFDLSEHHREAKREGRGRGRRGGGWYTLYLPISSVFGKYVGKGYGLSEEAYIVCGSCFALATIGYIYGALKVRVDVNRGFTVFNFVFIPRSKMSVRNLLLLQRLGGLLWVRKRGISASLNMAGALIYALSVGETLYVASDTPAVVAWITERSDNNQRSHRPIVLDVAASLRFIAKLKLEVPQWPKVVDVLATNEPTALNALGEYVLFGGDPYAVVRHMLSALRGQVSRRGGGLHRFVAFMEKITNVLLMSEQWSSK